MKLLIIGHARHGKDTVALFLQEEFGLTHLASSEASSTIFVFDTLKEKYGYSTPDECFADRENHRKEWYDLICEYNAEDRARLAKEIVKKANVYVGMRSQEELDSCIKQEVFDAIIGVIDPRKPLEPSGSMSIDVEKYADVIIRNDGTLDELRQKTIAIYNILKPRIRARYARREREIALREYWNNLPKFTKIEDIPELPRVDDPEEWKNFYVVKLIESGAIPKSLLKDRAYYLGSHRQATVAQWRADENNFVYRRRKFNWIYDDYCNHFEDDDRFALFVPIVEATQEQFNRNAE